MHFLAASADVLGEEISESATQSGASRAAAKASKRLASWAVTTA